MLLKIVLVFVLPALVFAQGSLQPYNETAAAMFQVADTNGDGVYARDEIHANFLNYDADGDGRVSRHEYTSVIEASLPELSAFAHGLYDIYDVDGDHHLDEHDYENFHSLMDGNGDGTVTEAEYVRYGYTGMDMSIPKPDFLLTDIYWARSVTVSRQANLRLPAVLRS